MRRAYIGILSLFILSGCTERADYKGKDLSKGWSYDDPITQVISKGSGTEMAMIINHSDLYEYQNLYLTLTGKQNKKTVYQDTLSILLADDSGYWLGDCKSNQCAYAYKVPWVESLDEISINQYSRDSTLMGITSIDLDLTASSK